MPAARLILLKAALLINIIIIIIISNGTVPLSMTLSDLKPTFQGHDNIQRQITLLIVSRV